MAFNGDKLRTLRLARGLTQAELAHRAHVRERQIIRWENAQHVPRAEAIVALARVLGVSVSDLFSDEGNGEEEDEDGDAVADLVKALTVFVRAVSQPPRNQEAA